MSKLAGLLAGQQERQVKKAGLLDMIAKAYDQYAPTRSDLDQWGASFPFSGQQNLSDGSNPFDVAAGILPSVAQELYRNTPFQGVVNPAAAEAANATATIGNDVQSMGAKLGAYLPHALQRESDNAVTATNRLPFSEEPAVTDAEAGVMLSPLVFSGGAGLATGHFAGNALRAGARAMADTGRKAAPVITLSRNKTEENALLRERLAGARAGTSLYSRSALNEGRFGDVPGIISDQLARKADIRKDAPNNFNYNIDKDGAPFGSLQGYVDGDTAKVRWLGSHRWDDGDRSYLDANALGVSGIRQLREQFRKDFPDVVNFEGNRISGARQGKASEYDKALKEGKTGSDLPSTGQSVKLLADTSKQSPFAAGVKAAEQSQEPIRAYHGTNVDFDRLWHWRIFRSPI